VDNDGNALVGGTLYFNSVAGAMKIYTGSAWVAAYVSGTDFVAKSGDTMTGALAATGFTGPLTGTVGATTPAAGAFTTLSASSTLSVTGAGSIQGLTIGRGAGAVATNTAVGASALGVNSSGGGNTAVGQQALQANTTAGANTAVGRQSLFTNTTGIENTANGVFSLYYNTTGSYNTAMGLAALQSNTTASNNTAVGYQAGYSSQTSDYNTFLGYRAGFSTTGDQNTFLGKFAGNAITSGATNTIVGAYNGNQASLDIRTASNYTVISDGGGTPHLAAYAGGTVALQGAIPVAGTGITFPATQSASSNANTLDDYEEGTWTPALDLSSGSATGGTFTGTYVKVGRQVTLTIYASVGTATSASFGGFTGLPFTSENVNQKGTGAIRENNATGNLYVMMVNTNSTTSVCRRYDNNTTVSTNMIFIGSVTYLTA